jgi:hypothetical protein
MSINPSRKTQHRRTGPGMLILGIFLVQQLLAGIFFLSAVESLENIKAPFFILNPPLLSLLSALSLYFAAWIYAGILRKFDKENHPVMTRNCAFFFHCGIIAIVLGLVMPHLDRERHYLALIIWAVPFLFLLAMPLGYFMNSEQYMELLGLNRKARSAVFPIGSSNLTISILLFMIWAVVSFFAGVFVGYDFCQCATDISVLLSFYLVICFLYETHALLGTDQTKIVLRIANIAPGERSL